MEANKIFSIITVLLFISGIVIALSSFIIKDQFASDDRCLLGFSLLGLSFPVYLIGRLISIYSCSDIISGLTAFFNQSF